MKLSILIPTLESRAQLFHSLHHKLTSQIEAIGAGDRIEIVPFPNRGQYNIGLIRNNMLQEAKGEYVVFVDDDDDVMPDYISSIDEALQQNPDVVTFRGWVTDDGKNRVDWIIRLGEKYEARDGKYYRYPNHLCPVKKELAVCAKYPNVKNAEDYEWATEIMKKGLLKKEVFIDKELYHYRHKTNK